MEILIVWAVFALIIISNIKKAKKMQNERNAERTLTDIGLSMSTAINIFLKKVARENRIPFELSADPFYSQENMDELERRVANVRAGKSTLKEHELIEVQ